MSKIPRWPVSTRVLAEARLYALESIDYTANYEGWEDQDGTQQKLHRITTGRFGQLYVAEFCRLNDIPCRVDATSPHLVDKYDLVIGGRTVDVKMSYRDDISCQVSPGVYSKPCDYFCFILTDRGLTYVEPLGFISAEDYKARARHVPYGERFPNSSIQQRFKNGSYVMDASYLAHFWFALHDVGEHGDWIRAVGQRVKKATMDIASKVIPLSRSR